VAFCRYQLVYQISFFGEISCEKISVADPDPHVFGPPGSGSISQRYGSESGSFYHQAKIVRKTMILTALCLLFDFLSLKMMEKYLQKLIGKILF
jgi:hypothetical protein